MKTYKSRSTERPPVWDRESCPEKIYNNTNVVEDTQTDPETGETVVMFEYDVTEYTNREYINFQSQLIDEQADALIELAGMIGG